MIPVGDFPPPTMPRVRMPGMNDKALQALTKAWIMTVIATALLSVALALSPVWDSAGYLSALPGALSLGQ
jgi:ABC-type arginine transport system permease subunit